MSNPTSHQPMEATIGQHHSHRDNEPLPGAKGAEPTVDYSPDTMEHTKLPPSEEGNTQDLTPHPRARHQEPPTQKPGGASLDDSTPPPANQQVSGSTKPSFGDKVIGKTQELTGKVLHKEGLQEKGELRKLGENM